MPSEKDTTPIEPEDLKLRHLPILVLAGVVALFAALLWPDELKGGSDRDD